MSNSLLFTFEAHKKKIADHNATRSRIAALLNGATRVAVIGNGPISEQDRKTIEGHSFVVRFNDMNNFRKGEKVSLRVQRHPSDPPKINLKIPIWHVSPRLSSSWENQITTLAYEHQLGARNEAPSNSRIFPSCNCGQSCFENSEESWAGASTGAIALSTLNSMPEIKQIDVFGMNWNAGRGGFHVDFKNATLVKGCCNNCHFYQTASRAYGSEQPVSVILLIIVGSVVALGLFFYFISEMISYSTANGACDACGPPPRRRRVLRDDELMKGDVTSSDEEDDSDDSDNSKSDEGGGGGGAGGGGSVSASTNLSLGVPVLRMKRAGFSDPV